DAGEYSVKGDVSELPSGTYLYHIKAGLLNETKKLIVTR
ncbi:MAG: peptidase S8, partial [Cytophaga sp.]|nr:peptidase S8 [Cytophaga sp.]